MNKPVFSIIIPVRVETDYLRETLLKLKNQTFRKFEILVITDKISNTASPAQKRNLGAKKSRGEFLAFLDDDSYPHNLWLENAFKQLDLHKDVCAVCGPCLTPPSDNLRQQASGLVWSSYLGSGGAGAYRNQISTNRFVDDFPSVNLIVRKKDFIQVGGFDTHHWPGEDTILCLNLVYKLHRKILYHPSIIVYHHRRKVIIPHLQQITRYAIHRGNFAKFYPKTSLKIGYLMPSFFVIYLLSLFFIHPNVYKVPLFSYLVLLLITFLSFLVQKQNIFASIFAVITIPITHVYYGILFIFGLTQPKLKFEAHKLDIQNQKYLGG